MKEYSEQSREKMKAGGGKGGQAKVKKGFAMFWETATPEQKEALRLKSKSARWNKDAQEKT